MNALSVNNYAVYECDHIRSVLKSRKEGVPGQSDGVNEWYVLDDVLSFLQIERSEVEKNMKYVQSHKVPTPLGLEEIDIIPLYEVSGLLERNSGERFDELGNWIMDHPINLAGEEIFRRFTSYPNGLNILQSQYLALNTMYLSDKLPVEVRWNDEEMKSIRDLIDMLIGGDAPMFMQHIRTMWIENNIIWEDKTRNNEFYWQGVFKDVYPKIANVEIVDRKNDGKNIPDAWVKDKDEYIPVEVKLNAFNPAALKQLQRYIDAYGCSKGIAVGEKLTVELPENITFISLKELEEENSKLRKEPTND